ncbi:hypothetical protein [Pelosinus baikalensis]|uniref:Uncharacterized protein n=1 Tax=Pelosinus baikalensis TaxID=2892015 RepID=A0ABS8HSY3_9FIRM|nr:hypothetical protein [Pelosinus baikalensis]MCC5466260.1 hypothetical protein [Pelosinus baikalensis]
MRIFETAARELRHMHDAEELRCLEKVSEGYYQAEQSNNQLKKRLLEILSKEGIDIVDKMQENFTEKEILAGEIYYNQGFCDAIKLMMQSLAWESVRR